MKCPNCEDENCEMVEVYLENSSLDDALGVGVECLNCGMRLPCGLYENHMTDEETTAAALVIFDDFLIGSKKRLAVFATMLKNNPSQDLEKLWYEAMTEVLETNHE